MSLKSEQELLRQLEEMAPAGEDVTPEALKQIITGEANMEIVPKEAVLLSPPQLLQQAIASGAGIEVIERLLAAQERWDAIQAKKAFHIALGAFKANPPQILKDVEVAFEGHTGNQTSYKHEDLAKLLAVVDPALAEHGLWVRYKSNSDGGKVTITCVIGHVDGYSLDDNTLSVAPDTSGKKNPVQAIGSAASYLSRYTLKLALGMAASRDDDGRDSGAPITHVRGTVISEEQAAKVNAALFGQTEKLKKRLLELAHVESVEDIATIHFESVMGFIKKYGKEEKYEA